MQTYLLKKMCENLVLTRETSFLPDTRTEITDTGFIKARYLDDKAGVAALYGMITLLEKRKVRLSRDVHLLFAIREEVGGGASTGLPEDVEELIVVDMGVAAPTQYCDEFSCCICMKDGSGPVRSKADLKAC